MKISIILRLIRIKFQKSILLKPLIGKHEGEAGQQSEEADHRAGESRQHKLEAGQHEGEAGQLGRSG